MTVYLGGIDGLEFGATQWLVFDLDFRDVEGGSF